VLKISKHESRAGFLTGHGQGKLPCDLESGESWQGVKEQGEEGWQHDDQE
jgi:hypothetical protein